MTEKTRDERGRGRGNPALKKGKMPVVGRPWPKGVSGNPTGKSKKQAERERRNAERATRIRGRLLQALERDLKQKAEADCLAEMLKAIHADNLRLLKDAEDRGLGAPKQELAVVDEGRTDEDLLAILQELGFDPKDLGLVEGEAPEQEPDAES